MFDPLKTATARQFPILHGLSQQQITDTATRSCLYRIFHKAGYSDAWIAADVLAWQRLLQTLIVALPVAMVVIFLITVDRGWLRIKAAQGYLTTLHHYPGELF